MKLFSKMLFATSVATGLVLGAANIALASPQAVKIIEDKLKVEALRQNATGSYFMDESHKQGLVQGTFLYMSPCEPKRFSYIKITDFSPEDDEENHKGTPQEEFRELCHSDQFLGYSMVRPKEVEYMLNTDQYDAELVTTLPVARGLFDLWSPNVGKLTSKANDKAFAAAKGYLNNYAGNDIKRDIMNAQQDVKDLREFGQKANVVGSGKIKDRDVWVMLVDNVGRVEETEEGTATTTHAALIIDKQNYVTYGLAAWGTMKQGRKTTPFYVIRIDEDYRKVEGGHVLVPFTSKMAFAMELESDPKLEKEMAEARKAYEDAKKMMSDPAIAGNPMAKAMMEQQMAKMGEMIEASDSMNQSSSTPSYEDLKLAFDSDFQEKRKDYKDAKFRRDVMANIFDGTPVTNTRTTTFARKGDVEDYVEYIAGAYANSDK